MSAPVQEPDNPAPVPVASVLFGALSLCIVLACVAAIGLQLRLSKLARANRTQGAVAAGAQVSALHMDEFRASGEGDQLRAQQAAGLRKYAWVDRERGLVRIPIDVAITLELEEAGR
jgi:hypothetical protein